MALGDERRASGQAMEQARRNIGRANEAARRAGGEAMEASRRGRQVVEDINRLTRPQPVRRSLPTVEPVGARPAARGRGVYTPPPATQGGGGIAGPLVEVSRTYAPDPEYIETIDGSGYFKVRRVASITMKDANDNEVVFTYLQAPPTI